MKRVSKRKASGRTEPDRRAVGRAEETILLVLVLIEPLLFTPWTRNPFAAKDLFFAVVLLALSIARLTAVRARRAPGRAPLLPVAALAVVVFLNLVLAAVSSAPSVSIAHACRLLGYGALFLLVASRPWDTVFFRRFAAMTLAGTIVASVYGMLQVAHLDPVPWADKFPIAGAPFESMRMFSTFGHPNFFGSHLAMALFFAGAALLLSENTLQRAAAAAGILLGVPCLLLTLNRGAWVGFLAAVVATAALVWSARRRGGLSPGATAAVTQRLSVVAVIGGLTVVAVLIALAWSPTLRQRLDLSQGFKEPTVQSRLLVWSGALKMIRERPLVGAGPGTFGDVFPFYRDERLSNYHDELTPVTHAHNEYLEVVAETGALGFLALVFFVAVVLQRGRNKVHEARSEQERIIPATLLAGAVSILVGSLFGVELRHVNAAVFLWMLLGFMAAEPFPPAGSPYGEARERIPALTAIVAGAGAVVFFVVILRMFVGEMYLNRGERSLAIGALGMAALEGRAARAWNPTDHGGLMLGAEALVRSKDYAGARKLYREVGRISPGEPLIGYNLALMEYFLGNYDESLKEVEMARKLYPRHAPTRSLHYDLWLKKGLERVGRADLEGAKEAFRAAELINHNDPRAISFLGNVHVKEGLYDAAIDRYRLALQMDPTFGPAAENLEKVMALQAR